MSRVLKLGFESIRQTEEHVLLGTTRKKSMRSVENKRQGTKTAREQLQKANAKKLGI